MKVSSSCPGQKKGEFPQSKKLKKRRKIKTRLTQRGKGRERVRERERERKTCNQQQLVQTMHQGTLINAKHIHKYA